MNISYVRAFVVTLSLATVIGCAGASVLRLISGIRLVGPKDPGTASAVTIRFTEKM
jgi:hypothetical protein